MEIIRNGTHSKEWRQERFNASSRSRISKRERTLGALSKPAKRVGPRDRLDTNRWNQAEIAA